jgi:Heavy metal associated domain 2
MVYKEIVVMFLKDNEKKPLFLWVREMMAIKGIRVSHFIPGRVRLKAAAIKDNPPFARQVIELFEEIRGINQVEANFLTGSLLIEYEAAELRSPESADQLAEALRHLLPQVDREKVMSLLEWL